MAPGFFALALEWANWEIGEPHVQTGMTSKRSLEKTLKDALLGCHYVSAFDLSDTRLDETLKLLDRYGIQYLWGYPGSIYYLARRATERGFHRPLLSVATSGDNLHAHYRKSVEAAFETRVFDTYGCAEGVQIAAQCGHEIHITYMLWTLLLNSSMIREILFVQDKREISW